MAQLGPPSGSLIIWTRQLYNWLMQQQLQQNSPKPVLLARLQPEDNATQDGVLMWDADAEVVVVSKAGAWVPL